ncbi:metallophosphoesterase [Paenibacillus sp. FSL R10-2734]|uniref:metallophosphoesterase n=1 Tax=Paenibacillus sp. FSL R10-2734 TaxID=2954691 RepID=UPI0030DD346B
MNFSTDKATTLYKKTVIFSSVLLLSLSLALTGCKDTNSSNLSAPVLDQDDLQPVSFWVATDTHFLDKNLQDGGQAFQTYVTGGDGKMLPYSDEMAETLVYEAEQKKPEFIILSGDLTNNGERSSHQQLTEKLKRIEQQGTSVYVIPGNHDLFNPWARSFSGDKQLLTDSITDKDFVKMYADFGYEEAVSRDKESLSYIVKAAPNLWILMLDSSQYLNNQKYGFPQTDGRIAASTLSWIDESVKLAAKEHASVITVMHHNLLDHTTMSVSGFKLNNSQETINALRKNGLNLVLSGHIHLQDIQVDQAAGNQDSASSEQTPIYDIATSAMAVNPHQYGAMTFDPLSRTVNYKTEPLNVEVWAKATGITDHNLLNFKAYAENIFATNSYDKAIDSLKDSSYTESEKESMAKVMSKLNVRYFAGTTDTISKDIKELPGYKLWEEPQDGFLAGYVQSMAEDKALSNVALEVVLTKQ